MLNYLERLKNRFLENTGFDDHIGDVGERILTKNGKGNVHKKGFSRLKHLSLFHTLIELKIWKFWTVCFIGFIGINLVFGTLYYYIGCHFILVPNALSEFDRFLECLYFSSQTLTAVGYGRLAPANNLANALASFEAFFGLMSFAVITGLLYARFSKPKAFLMFSKNAIIRPFRDGKALMFRFATYKNNDLTDVSCEVVAAFTQTIDGVTSNRFVPLELDIKRIQELVLNWTVVHIINENSPFHLLTKEEIEASKFEVIILVKGYDEYFATTVQERTSYLHNEILYDVKFTKMFYKDDDKNRTVLNLDKISAVEPV